MKQIKSFFNFLNFRLLILSILIFKSCSNRAIVSVDDIGLKIPDVWQIPIPISEDIVGKWWEIFQDENLENFIFNFRKNSPDIQSILESKKMAYHNSKINSPNILPSLNSSIRADTSMQNLTGFGDAAGEIFGGQSGEIISFENSTAGLGFNLQWEIDIWGRLSNAKIAAGKNYESINYDLTYLGFSSVIRAAQSYFQTVEAYEQMKIAQESYNSYTEIRDLVKNRYEKGLKSSLDYRLAETSVSTSIVLVETRKIQLSALRRRLETLLGKYPKGQMITSKALPDKLPIIEKAIPADIIIRRPDLKSLFLKTESEGLLLMQAKRNRLPGISISGSAGTSAQKLNDIFNEDYGIWSVGLNLATPIFNSGKLKSAVKFRESSKEKAKKDLLKGLLNAYSEVEQLLQINQSLSIQQESINNAVQQSLDAYNLSKERYDKGVTTLESVLNSQRQYNNVRSQYLTLKRQRIENRLSLILALGGDLDNNG